MNALHTQLVFRAVVTYGSSFYDLRKTAGMKYPVAMRNLILRNDMNKAFRATLLALGVSAFVSPSVNAATCPQSALGGWWYGTVNVVNSADVTKNYVGNCVYQFDNKGNLLTDGNQSYCIVVSSDPVTNGSTKYLASGSLIFASGSCSLTGAINWKTGGVSNFQGRMNPVGRSVINGTFLSTNGAVGTLSLTK